MKSSARTFHSFLATAISILALSSCSSIQESADPDARASFSQGKGHTAVPSEGTFAIDLATTLQLAAGRNLELATAIEKANSAAARSRDRRTDT